ncbi:MAG TPA: phosphate ABC transporter permease subunit PstC [Candidatus Binatia bacterium]|nr:phosphate ABC transporter permease subunit PstC [Candidatus Binatia bacterium]
MSTDHAGVVGSGPRRPLARTAGVGVARTPTRRARRRVGDPLFRLLTLGFAISVIVIAAVIAGVLFVQSGAARSAFGWSFVWTSIWDPVALRFGALPFVYGTLASTAIALALAVPLGLGAAICLAELLPTRLADALTFLIELLVAVPSVVYGLVAVFVLVPVMRAVAAPIQATLGFIPLFAGPAYGVGLLTAAIVLAIMIVPFIIAVSREVLLAVPQTQRDAALALGATRWETVRDVVLPYARSGILGSIFLALARALGETMAVTMVIGNRPEISASLFAPAYTMAAVLANEFTEATDDLYLSALVEIGLLLFVITVIVNAFAQLLISSVRSSVKGAA